jgi:hypothetical protein
VFRTFEEEAKGMGRRECRHVLQVVVAYTVRVIEVADVTLMIR